MSQILEETLNQARDLALRYPVAPVIIGGVTAALALKWVRSFLNFFQRQNHI
jgi:hypothetical protein